MHRQNKTSCQTEGLFDLWGCFSLSCFFMITQWTQCWQAVTHDLKVTLFLSAESFIQGVLFHCVTKQKWNILKMKCGYSIRLWHNSVFRFFVLVMRIQTSFTTVIWTLKVLFYQRVQELNVCCGPLFSMFQCPLNQTGYGKKHFIRPTEKALQKELFQKSQNSLYAMSWFEEVLC